MALTLPFCVSLALLAVLVNFAESTVSVCGNTVGLTETSL